MKLWKHSGLFCALWPLFLYIVLLFSMILLQPNIITASASRNDTDRFALLKFKESIANDPHGVLSSWNDSIHFCNWPGITCAKKQQRTIALNLEGYNLRGTLSPYVGNLTFLRFINLENNSFFGEIPEPVGRLFQLQYLDLSSNMLEGKIPLNLSHCSKLKILRLGTNRLTGMIPMELGFLVNLVQLDLSKNNLTGGIPSSLGNVSSLTEFKVIFNNLVGAVPDELGRLKSLTGFGTASNNLYGTIPLSLYNISSMRIFSVSTNQLEGSLPPNVGFMFPNLQFFAIGDNHFSGMIPESFSNASQLQVFDIASNNFFGKVPDIFGNLPDLNWLGLSYNTLGNYSSNSLDFIASLSNCSQLDSLDFAHNEFGGVLPHSVANLSTKLTQLLLGTNKISGNIPDTIGNLANLFILNMRENLFTGFIPASLWKLQNLQVLYLNKNNISGKIPSAIGNLTQLSELYLGNNRLEGSIPLTIANFRNLQYLDLSHNNLNGAIPREVLGLSSYIALDFSQNSLTGRLPVEVGKLKNIYGLYLSENNLFGQIPETIGECQSLGILHLQGNFFQGALPSALSSLRSLQLLDISRNKLTGDIPKDLQKLQLLLYLNLSYNNLEGQVPNEGIFLNTSAISLVGNTRLCGGVPKLQLPPCSIEASKQQKKIRRRLKLTIIVVCVAAFSLMFSCFLIFYCRRKSTRKSSSDLSTINFLSNKVISYKHLHQATNGFSPSLLVGIGGFGSVYKGILEHEENPVAIKVLNLQRKGASKSFIVECNALRNVRHRNLVKILSCCSSIDYNANDFKALVFEFMPSGSLEEWLHLIADNENRSKTLNLVQRLNIAIDVATAIHYLHDQCGQMIIHCDLKPSNILLDGEMIAHVGDFGLARLMSNANVVSQSQTSTIGLKGTIGYAPPEYAMGSEPSKQGDVYSYGILMLEMFTGKRPTDEMFKDDFNLRNFVKTALPERLVQIVDATILPSETDETTVRREVGRNYINNEDIENLSQISTHLQKCLVSVLQIGLACSKESPKERMSMGDVVKEIQQTRNAYLDIGIHEQRDRTS